MVLVRLIEKYINFAGKNGAKFLRTPVFFLGLSGPQTCADEI